MDESHVLKDYAKKEDEKLSNKISEMNEQISGKLKAMEKHNDLVKKVLVENDNHRKVSLSSF